MMQIAIFIEKTEFAQEKVLFLRFSSMQDTKCVDV